MQGMMMDYQLTLLPILERARRLFGKKQIVTRVGPVEQGEQGHRVRIPGRCRSLSGNDAGECLEAGRIEVAQGAGIRGCRAVVADVQRGRDAFFAGVRIGVIGGEHAIEFAEEGAGFGDRQRFNRFTTGAAQRAGWRGGLNSER